MSSWVKIRKGIIVKYSDGPHGLAAADGWREVTFPAKQWKLDAIGRVIKKTQANLDAAAQPKLRAEVEDHQRIQTRIAALLTAFKAGDPAPLGKFLTGVVMRFRDLEKELN